MNFLIVGCGNMSTALAISMARAADHEIGFYTYDIDYQKSETLAKSIGAMPLQNYNQLAKIDFLFLGIKPQSFDEVSGELKKRISNETVVISILAGVTIDKIQKSLEISKVVRAMPNTPALIGEGVTALCFSENISNAAKKKITNLFKATSHTFKFQDEEFIDVITGFSGSGPAYIFEIARILIDKMCEMGVDREISQKMIKQTFFGASKLMVESDKSPEELRNTVTSKNGVTYEALNVFNEKGLDEIISLALDRAYDRAKELSI